MITIFKLLNDKDTYNMLKVDLTKNCKCKLNKFIFELYKIDCLHQKEYLYYDALMLLHSTCMGYQKSINQIVSFINLPLYNPF